MKRLLVLLIVCAVASIASATTTVDIFVNTAPYTGQGVEYSDIVHLVLTDDLGSAYMAGTIAIGSYIDVSDGDNYAHNWTNPPTSGGWIITPVGGGYTSAGNAAWMFQNLPASGIIFDHEFHIPDLEESTYITIDYLIDYMAAGATQYVLTDTVILHVVPEPATIALLGLGALSLLRRRRKA